MLAGTNLIIVFATMTQNKYYLPKLEELFVGYECEKRMDCGLIGEYDSSPSYWCYDDKGNDVDCFLKGSDMIPTVNYKITGEDIYQFDLFLQTGSNMMFSEGKDIRDIRTKHLDRLDIESLGWVISDRKESTDDRTWFYKIEVTDEGTEEEYDLRHNLLFINSEWGITVVLNLEMARGHFQNGFDGSCPSINELRTIQKLLGI